MSQITRCPACATQFKVVADQLRISEGWVRCGQCKEVFDAAAYLVAAPPPPMLPDVSLTDTRPPLVVVSRPAEERGAWGVFDPPAPRPAAGRAVAQPAAPVPAPVPAMPSPVAPVASAAGSSGARVGEAFDIPAPTVPAFLSATRPPAVAPGADELSLEPLQTFGWRAPVPLAPLAPLVPLAPVVPVAPLAPPVPATPPAAAVPPAAAAAAFVPPPPREESRVLPGLAASLLADLAPVASPAARPREVVDPAAEGMALPAGYELPVADFSDSLPAVDRDGYGDDGPDTEIMSLPEGPGDGDAYPSLDLPPAVPAAQRDFLMPDEEDDDHDDGVPLFGHVDAVPEPGPRRTPVASPSSTSGFSDSVTPFPADADFELMPDPVFPASAPARPDGASGARGPAAAAALDADEDDELPAGHSGAEEVSFVRAARRKAFWRRPLVRSVLALVLVLLLGVLALQVAVHERNRIAAMDSRSRPWLQQLCAHVGCTLAPQRQIADLVIDSSSFNKARGDGYVLALTVKSRAEIPLEMPAVELTLTDAQDQPVLRRVLLPADLAAPAELAARGEWSTSVSVVVTSGASRVSGYRVMTFYP